jgi:hypothetical protein
LPDGFVIHAGRLSVPAFRRAPLVVGPVTVSPWKAVMRKK